MARTLDPVANAVRRDAFVDVGETLIRTKGYERMSIQDVLDAAGASRGAFYHYFDSKLALLDAVIERMSDTAIGTVRPVLERDDLSAPDKLSAVFGGIAQWKAEQRDLVLALMDVWLADENAIVREKFRRRLVQRMVPILAPVLADGRRRGDFDIDDPVGTARVLVSLLQGASESATELFSAHLGGRATLEDARTVILAYGPAFDRILGVAPGSLRLFDPRVLDEWFA